MTIEEIEHKIACGELSAAQVFTQMRQFICRSDLELAAPDLYEALNLVDRKLKLESLFTGAEINQILSALAKARGE